MFERILVPLDGSPLAECTIPHALALATTFSGEIHLLNVVEPPPGLDGGVDGAEWRMARAETRGYLNRMARRISERGARVDSCVLEGSPPARTLDCAADRRMDVILLSRHARGGVTDFPMSGTAFKIVSGARCSVLLARGRLDAGLDAGYGRILAPVDCSRRADWGAHLAAAVARSTDAELVLAAVVPTPEVLGEASEWHEQSRLARRLAELNRETAHAHLDGLAENLSTDGLSVRTRVLEDPEVGSAVQRLSEDVDAGLVVVSAHGRTGRAGGTYGSVAKYLLDVATRPLLVLQDLQRQPRRHTWGRDRAREQARTPRA